MNALAAIKQVVSGALCQAPVIHHKVKPVGVTVCTVKIAKASFNDWSQVGQPIGLPHDTPGLISQNGRIIQANARPMMYARIFWTAP